MRTGVVQQAASPKELYERPVNLFVAGFIGSPSMNFLSGTLEEGMLRTSLGDFRLSDRIRQEVERSGTGRDVIVGLRPENFEDAALVSADNRPHGITFRAKIDVYESLGSDVFVYFTRELGKGVSSAELQELAQDAGRADSGATGETIAARLDAATRIAEGQDAELWVDARPMHIFDPASGRNLSLASDEGGPVSLQPAPARTDTARTDTARTDAAEPQAAAPDVAGSGDVQAAPGQARPSGEAP
jgi:multiple sugar transport system ATP-binding protein